MTLDGIFATAAIAAGICGFVMIGYRWGKERRRRGGKRPHSHW